ncbi:nucleotide-diphospho-sugar transferase [Pedobacter sp. ASV28]|uniref:nucleotide-diphospho-sugar transferase n=1 Tax=Pedobacter sp. ASV28 TaxID=2795123 RepID=UPI0018EC9D82|nr:nucleotide-diphospho-sugar transferase [Pedobacter sp. ASV28]
MTSPVLYLIFNRIDETKVSFETIRKAKPPKLYVAADGSRSSVDGEDEVCKSVREIAINVDWECEVFTLFRENNLGCKTAIIEAIDWFFENETEGIIIEDDVIPNEEFFPFCDSLLDRYRNNNMIKAINGFNQFGQEVTSNSYFYSRGFYPWGWATWRTRWANYKADNIDISRLNDKDIRSVYHKAAIEGVKFNLNIINKGVLDTWDYQMVYMIMNEKGFVITPFANLTSNIGVNGAHSTNNQNIFFKYGKMSIDTLVHPKQIVDNEVMNAKLWEEYKEAYFSVKIKSILFKTNLYEPLRALYKRMMKFYLSFSK